MAHFAVSAIGRDRPGIVAAIATTLLELDGNVEDSRMTILRGQFAVMLIVTLPGSDGDALGAELRRRLEPVRDELGLDALAVSEVGETTESTAAATHVITVYGADHPGIVHSVSAELAQRGVNITDLQTKLAGADDKPLYVMMIEVELGANDPGELTAALAAVGEQAAVEVSVGEIAPEAL